MSDPSETEAQGALLERLPATLAERVEPRAHASPADGSFVLLWMRMALRGHENPALDVALELGRALGLPVLAYQCLSERHPQASDRLHHFLLEGADELSIELTARGVPLALHVEREGHRGPHLRTLAERAAVVVTEETPVEPLRSWTRSLAAKIRAPLLRVDTACVLPMRLVEAPPERAFSFRRATEAARAERLERPWIDAPNAHPITLAELRDAIPFEAIDPAQADLTPLIARAAIDHSVGPVAHTRGGSRSGYARWEAFQRDGLAEYHRARNDPLRAGVSRMSAYLHAGMVSPLRLARESAALEGPGAAKYLDELLIWRELAHAFCFHTEALDALSALPEWAQATLREHAEDPRARVLSDETLARGRTGDALWDTAQASLLRHGELHNNARMTWGKALLDWSASPAQALSRLVELNHRYALDGRDPSSYGGLLWCLGLFDRPFEPERAVAGVLRARPSTEHAKRLDVARWSERIAGPSGRRRRIAVVGAGLSGLLAARTLQDHGHELVVIDKGRGVGGRCSTRRRGELQWDHGCQLLKDDTSPRGARRLESWLHDGVIAPWEARFVRFDASGSPRDDESRTKRRFVGAPGMNAIPRALAAELDVRSSTRVEALAQEAGLWTLHTEGGESLSGFDACVLALPPAQAAELLRGLPTPPAEALALCESVQMTRSLSVLTAAATPWALPFDAATLDDPILAWAARDSSKPGRPRDTESWELQATPSWSAAHFEDSPDAVVDALTARLAQRSGVAPPIWTHGERMRWGYAVAQVPASEHALLSKEGTLALCGDWLGGNRLGDALRSGEAAAGRLLGAFHTADRGRSAL